MHSYYIVNTGTLKTYFCYMFDVREERTSKFYFRDYDEIDTCNTTYRWLMMHAYESYYVLPRRHKGFMH